MISAEFESNIRQVGEHNTKGLFITNVGFQEGAYQSAVNYGISLILPNMIGSIKLNNWLIAASTSESSTHQRCGLRYFQSVRIFSDPKLTTIIWPYAIDLNFHSYNNCYNLGYEQK